MLEINPQYAPDLEWMLQSGQVPREVLLEALLEEHYASIYHLALSLLDDHAAAQSAAQQTFARALLDQHRYRSQDGVQLWLFRIALETCRRFQKRLRFRRSLKALLPRWSKPRDFGDSCPETLQDAALWLAVDSLEDQARQIVLFYAANGWQPERIAALFGVAESEVETVLAAARQLVAAPPQLDPSLPAGAALQPDQIDPCLAGSLDRRWPAREFSPAELEAQAAIILRRLRWLGFRQTKALAALELGLLVMIILLAFALVWGANTLAAEHSSATPRGPLPTILVTQLVIKVITATPFSQPSPETTSTPIQVAQSNYTEVRPGETLQDVAARLGVTVDELRYWNRLPDDAEILPGQRLINPQYARTLQPSAPTRVSPVEPLPTLEAPASIQSLIKLLTLGNINLRTVWFDATIIDYGPLGYVGPARLTHLQEWSSKDQILLAAGPYGALPEDSILVTSQGYLAKPASDTSWFSEWRSLDNYDHTSPTIQYVDKFNQAFSIGSLSLDSTIQVRGLERMAGYSTIQIDLFDPKGVHTSRVWVADGLGQIMRRIDYQAGDVPVLEYRINSLTPNVNFPPELFDLRLPWRGGFAIDYSGRPLELNAPAPEIAPRRAELTVQPAPAGYDFSHSPLTFQYAGSYSSFSPEAQYQVFAGQYFIGQVYLGNPWSMICDRSPDGMWIAYVSQPNQSHDLSSMLHWFDLSDPALRFFTLHNMTGITELAFSPDNRKLAFFSRPNPSVLGELSTLALPFQNVRPIFTTGDVKSLVWSPDGKYMAFIDRANPSSYQENVLVISVSTGQVVYSLPLDVLNRPVKDWPMVEWGVDFPVEMGGMDACAASPEP